MHFFRLTMSKRGVTDQMGAAATDSASVGDKLNTSDLSSRVEMGGGDPKSQQADTRLEIG